jgi:hypothetical protein
MKSTRWSTHCLAALVGACAIWASAAAQGQFFLDDFEDGNPADGSPVTWVADPPYDGGTHLIEQGSYVLTPDDVSDYPSTDFSELDLAAEGRLFRAVSVRTTARLLASQLASNLYIGLVGRSTVDAQGKQATGVWGAVRSGGRLTLGVFNAELNRDQVWQGSYGPASTPIVGQDINLQLDIFADSAALTAWNVGDPRPAKPQIVAPNLPDYVPAQGRVGLWTGQNILARGRPMAPVAYHYLEAAPVPEPTCLAMIAIALAGCLRRPIRRSGRCLANTAGATLLIAGLVVAGQPAHAATVFYDDFEDGSATDGSPVTWSLVSAWPQTTIGVDQGNLRIGTSRIDRSAVAGVQDLHLSTSSIRAQVRLEGPGDSVAVALRASAAESKAHDLEIAGDGTIWLGLAGQWESVASDLRPLEEDVLLQLDAVGTKITGWAWRAGEAKPAEPIYRRTTSQLPAGFPGVYYGDTTSDGASGVAIFRYVHVADSPIPEPSTLGLLSLVAASGLRRTSRPRLPAVR